VNEKNINIKKLKEDVDFFDKEIEKIN